MTKCQLMWYSKSIDCNSVSSLRSTSTVLVLLCSERAVRSGRARRTMRVVSPGWSSMMVWSSATILSSTRSMGSETVIFLRRSRLTS